MAPINLMLIAGFYVALIVAKSNPNGTFARIAAFVPPFAPMVVPARMVLGDMNALGLIAAVIVDLLATAALMMLAARIYERAILRIGAPLKLRGCLFIAGLGTASEPAAMTAAPQTTRGSSTRYFASQQSGCSSRAPRSG